MTKLYLAIDTDDAERVQTVLDATAGLLDGIKIGHAWALAESRDLLQVWLLEFGHDLPNMGFIGDFKLHDIPERVASEVAAICRLIPWLDSLTVHIDGSLSTRRACEIATAQGRDILGVTTLTAWPDTDTQFAEKLAIAEHAGCAGVICPAYRAHKVPGALTVACPGWRLAGDGHDDHSVKATYQRPNMDVDIAIVGRPIMTAEQPQLAAERYRKALQGDH